MIQHVKCCSLMKGDNQIDRNQFFDQNFRVLDGMRLISE